MEMNTLKLMCEITNVDTVEVVQRLSQDAKKLDISEIIHSPTIQKTYLRDLEILRTLITTFDRNETKSSYVKQIEDVLWSVCFPMLHRLNPSNHTGEAMVEMLVAVTGLMAECLKKIPFENSTSVLNHLGVAIQTFCEECPGIFESVQHSESYMDISCILQILKTYLNFLTDKEDIGEVDTKLDSVFTGLISTFPLLSDKIFGQVITRGISRLLHLQPVKLYKRLTILFNEIKLLCDKNGTCSKPEEDRALIMFCSLADCYLPLYGGIQEMDLRCEDSFWKIVQRGLYSDNPLSRKRSLYLVKRIVDTCDKNKVDVNFPLTGTARPIFQWTSSNKEPANVWEDYMLLIEILEEKQVHVIKPILGRMRALVKAASRTGGDWCLHTSWLATVLCRCFKHESHQIIRWGVETVLGFDITTLPFLEQGQQEFLTGEFLITLQELRLYGRPHDADLGTCPPIGVELVSFLSNCVSRLDRREQKESFLRSLFETLLSTTWGSIPMFFICQALSNISCTPLFGPEMLASLKSMLVTLMTTMETLPKGAIQCFLLQTMLHLTDRDQVTVEEFSDILTVFDRSESLQRGTTLWSETAVWLKESVLSAFDLWRGDAVQKTLDKMTRDFLDMKSECGVYSSVKTMKIARLMSLTVDADLGALDKQGMNLKPILDQVTDVINGINSHAYMSKVKADRAVTLLAAIAREHDTIEGCSSVTYPGIQDAICGCWQELIVYISNRVTQDIQEMCDLGLVDVYGNCIKACHSYLPSQVCQQSLVTLTGRCIDCLQALQQANKCLEVQVGTVACWNVMGVMAALCVEMGKTAECVSALILEYTNTDNIVLSFPKLASRELNSVSISQKDWGRVVSSYICSQWQCIQLRLLKSCDQLSAKQILDYCYETFDVGTRDSDIHVLECVKDLLPKLILADEDGLFDMMRSAWAKANEEVHSASYWRKVSCFVDILCQVPLLLQPSGTKVNSCVLEHMSKLFELGEEKMGVINLLMQKLFPILVSDNDGIIVAANIQSLLADACVFGGLHKRTDRIVLELLAYIQSKGSKCSVNQILPRICKSDGLVRVFVVNFLTRLSPGDDRHVEFVSALLSDLCARYKSLAELTECRHYNNSLSHRQKNRIFQTVCVLEPFIAKEKDVDELWKFLWWCMVVEPHPSVRHMQEWLIMHLVYRFPRLVDKLWEHFGQFTDKRNPSLCSLIHIISKVGLHLSEDRQVAFYGKALPRILPWCMAHHFNTRASAQAGLTVLWQQCHDLGLHQLISQHSIIESVVTFHKSNNNSTKNLQKLINNYFYHTFHFLEDFSMETIFLTLPRLSMLTDEEWLPPDTFLMWDEGWSHGRSRFIPLYNPTSKLSQCSPGPWKIRPPVDTDVGDEEVTEGNVQKKIMPWRMMTPEDTGDAEDQMSIKKIHKTGGLVLVTSLIDKIPNLGGLCRTSEILGVSEFVIGNLCFLEDRAFQSLSVTAQNWIPITEVPPHKLQGFLEEKRRSGYTLVGVEQTANSTKLTQFKFPKKTLLLLGNEKEGVPVNLIQLLDVCVEIPQQGIIRSLNVHVSGALLVWEYARQQMDCEVKPS